MNNTVTLLGDYEFDLLQNAICVRTRETLLVNNVIFPEVAYMLG